MRVIRVRVLENKLSECARLTLVLGRPITGTVKPRKPVADWATFERELSEDRADR